MKWLVMILARAPPRKRIAVRMDTMRFLMCIPLIHLSLTHIYIIGGDPSKLSASTFTQWQFLMKSHVCSSSIELWKIIENGLHVGNPNNLTIREIVDSQLNATALHMIQLGVGDKDMPHIQHLSTAKEAWDALTELFIGNESMRRNRYDAL